LARLFGVEGPVYSADEMISLRGVHRALVNLNSSHEDAEYHRSNNVQKKQGAKGARGCEP